MSFDSKNSLHAADEQSSDLGTCRISNLRFEFHHRFYCNALQSSKCRSRGRMAEMKSMSLAHSTASLQRRACNPTVRHFHRELLTRRCTEQGVLGCILRLPKGQHYMRFEVDGADAVDDTLDVVLLNGQQLNVRFIQLDLLIAVLAELAC